MNTPTEIRLKIKANEVQRLENSLPKIGIPMKDDTEGWHLILYLLPTRIFSPWQNLH